MTMMRVQLHFLYLKKVHLVKGFNVSISNKPWLHAGTKPVDKPKYIIGGYLHYDDSFTKYVPAEWTKN